MGGPRWTKHEDNILINNAPHKTADELAAMLGCTDQRIRQRAYRLGIKIKRVQPKKTSRKKRKKDKKKYLHWTKEETAYLKRLLKEGYSYRYIKSKFPHRSPNSVHAMVHEKGLHSEIPKSGNKDWKQYEFDVVRTYGERLSCEEIRKFFLPHRSIHDILTLKNYYLINTKEEQ